ncbi:MAG: ribose-phosphate pyrophosphokinase, partial [Armatimonadetes bacterium]|nr:ribose-phosphate pyrophosphokinase [Armatimonadota bacterium]
DMIDTGGSVINGAEALINDGAIEVMACCTHAVFSGDAAQRMQDSVITRIVAMDTVPIGPDKQVKKLTVLPIAPLLGEAIKRIHLNRSVSTLFDDWR